jgi:hypothetical protein
MSHKRKRKSKTRSVLTAQANEGTRSPVEIVEKNMPSSPPRLSRKLSTIIACLIVVIVGFAAYAGGLTSPFQGDDATQIVNNPLVHSISNIKSFFGGGTFYSGATASDKLTGNFRPLMTTTFSVLYTLFGAHPLPFHLVQLLFAIGSAILVYLIFCYTFNPTVSLLLTLVFLVHPINSQVVYAIPSMQDVLCMFFGLLALWTLLRFSSRKSMGLVAVSLFLSLLAKESGVLFVAIGLLYLFWFDRRRFRLFAGMTTVPVGLWLGLRMNAVGFGEHLMVAPIDKLSLTDRLMNLPAVMQFYITKLIFPWKLASGYYWAYPTFSIRHVLLPLVVDLAVIGIGIYGAFAIRRRLDRAYFISYIFFAVWAVAGLLAYAQIVPLDETASETWFYFPMVGVLGMIGLVLLAYRPRIQPRWYYAAAALALVCFGLRTMTRGFDYHDEHRLLTSDVSVSKEDWPGYNRLANLASAKGDYSGARTYAERSIHIFPADTNYQNLGFALLNLHDYSGAIQAYQQGLQYGDDLNIYQSLGALTIIYGTYTPNKQFLLGALQKYPRDSTLWSRLAVLEAAYYQTDEAKTDIATAAQYGSVNPYMYNSIMNNQPFIVSLPGKTLKIP